VQDVRIVNIDEKPEPYMYLALGQAFMGQMTLMVETAGDPLLMGEQIRAEIVAVDSKVPALNMSTMSLLVRERLQPQRMAAAIVALLGLIGLVLAAVGLYGVMSYSVTQRTREIGIRMALGAQRSDVVSLVLRRGLTLALAGCAAGMAGAIAGTEVLSALLYGVSPRDPLAFAFALLVMIVVALAAAYIPARRAAKVDPIVALRCE
jgi:putative ABC transport system permease protein